jgi:hypothetical protein
METKLRLRKRKGKTKKWSMLKAENPEERNS